jgi:hypothetical protein
MRVISLSMGALNAADECSNMPVIDQSIKFSQETENTTELRPARNREISLDATIPLFA